MHGGMFLKCQTGISDLALKTQTKENNQGVAIVDIHRRIAIVRYPQGRYSSKGIKGVEKNMEKYKNVKNVNLLRRI